jgi:hypothetical protein
MNINSRNHTTVADIQQYNIYMKATKSTGEGVHHGGPHCIAH